MVVVVDSASSADSVFYNRGSIGSSSSSSSSSRRFASQYNHGSSGKL